MWNFDHLENSVCWNDCVTRRIELANKTTITATFTLIVPFLILLDSDDSDSPEIAFRQEQYTVEDAVEHMGFGWFQVKIFFICGLFSVSIREMSIIFKYKIVT